MSKNTFRADFRMGNKLGSGAFADVFFGKKIETNESFAIKVISKSNSQRNLDDARREIEVLNSLAFSQNIVTLYDVYEDSQKIYMVLELLTHGELFDQIAENVFYSERDGSVIICAILEAINDCHSNHVVHRDIKPENLLCGGNWSDENLTDLKIADFGTATYLEEGKKTTGDYGTPPYKAPEIWLGKAYDFKCDMWSIGCVAYILLGGYAPFTKDNDYRMTLKNQITSGRFEFHSPEWDEVSDVAKDFISKLLLVNPEERLDMKEALCHPFIGSSGVLSTDAKSNMLESLRGFNAKRKLISATLSLMGTKRLLSAFKQTKTEKTVNDLSQKELLKLINHLIDEHPELESEITEYIN